MKLLNLLIITVTFFLSSLESQSQTQITTVTATASPNNSYASCALQSGSGCPQGWFGNVPMLSGDWIQFDLQNKYLVTQVSVQVNMASNIQFGGFQMQGSTDNSNWTTIVNQSNINLVFRYVRFTSFVEQSQTGLTPIYFSAVKFYGYSNIDGLNVNGNLQVTGNSNIAGSITTNGIYNSKSDISLQTNGTTRMTISNSTGNVGIGTTTPGSSYKLDVNGLTHITGSINMPSTNNGILFGDNVNSGPRIWMGLWNNMHAYIDYKENLYFRADNPGVSALTLYGDGTVGVGFGTTYTSGNYPTAGNKLAVNGTLQVANNNSAFNMGGNDRLSLAAKSTFSNVPFIEWRVANGNRQAYLGWDPSVFNLTLENGYNFAINGGNVLIGQSTQVNSNYKLDVKGYVRANELVVNTDGSDFVFENSYKLRNLRELEIYVKQNKHLPEISTAKEMKENGVGVSELQTKLLQKVEELTLYIIEQNKRIETLETEIKKLK